MRANTVAKHLMIALAIALLVLASGWLPAQENCTYRKDALGNWNDNRTGNRYRKDSLGNYRSSDGEDVWRKDSLGNWRNREGRRCREDALGHLVCE